MRKNKSDTMPAEIDRDEETQTLVSDQNGPAVIRLPFSWDVVTNMFIFFFAMIVMELSLEGASTHFPELDSLAATVTLFQFGYCFTLPLLISRGQALQTFPSTFKQLIPYIKLSMLVFGATALSTKSIKYVSYPTKVVFKSAKLIPTMIVSTILNKGSKYGPYDYVAAVLLCLSAAGFSFGSKGTSNSDENQSHYGIILLTISIICDACVPNIQFQLMHPEAKKTTEVDASGKQEKASQGLSASAVMLNVNAVGFVCVFLFMLLNGSLVKAAAEATENPKLLMYLHMIGIGLGTAVWAYTRLIKASSSVTAVTVATVRKVVTILLSYIVYPKPIYGIHIVSACFFLGGILLNSFCRSRH